MKTVNPNTGPVSIPFQLTTTFNLNEGFEQVGESVEPVPTSPGLSKNLHFNLPPGLLGNVTNVPTCSGVQFGSTKSQFNACPENTAIGEATVCVEEPRRGAMFKLTVPVFNLEPQEGEPARFGFNAVQATVYLDTPVLSGEATDTPRRRGLWGESERPRSDDGRQPARYGSHALGRPRGYAARQIARLGLPRSRRRSGKLAPLRTDEAPPARS